MHRIHSIALATGLIAAVGIGTASAQTPPPPTYPQTPPPQTQRDKPDMPKPATSSDAEFAQKALMGGKHEIDGAKFALSKTTNADVKALANRLIKDHETANNELSSLMRPDAAKPDAAKPDAARPDATRPDATKPDATKPDATKPDAMKADAAQGSEAWRSLSGTAFDRGWADHLIAEHQKTVSLYETEANSGSDAKLKAFAAKTLPTIREHLKAAQDLRSKLGTT
jgi:putative membrane protein